MTTNPFAAPAAATGGVDLKTINGALLIIKPAAVESGIQTVHGPSDAIRADLYVVDGPLGGEVYEDTLLFPKVLQGQLKARVGQLVIGRLGQGQAKPGQSAPWVLQEATAADIAAGAAFWEKQQADRFATPATGGAATPF